MLRPLLFRMSPERAHHTIFSLTRLLQAFPIDAWRDLRGGGHPRLAQELFGQDFSTPLGLAAGLDKDGTHIRLWQLLGFGFVEIGSVTAQPAAGNPQPRLFRLPADAALLNRMGLNNAGAALVKRNVAQVRSRVRVPLGINLAKTHSPDIMGAAALDDFVESYKLLAPLASYITLNVSCPNTTEGKTFEDPDALSGLLEAVSGAAASLEAPPPLLVKLSPPAGPDWRPDDTFHSMLQVLLEQRVDGLIIANTAAPSSIATLKTSAQAVSAMGRGGLSGRPLQPGALEMLRVVYELTEGKLPLVGVGGVDSAAAAYAMIKAGASLVQLYTGLIYQGPGVVRKIHKGLVEALDADGFATIGEAVGQG